MAKIKFKKEFEGAYEELKAISEHIDEMIEKPENEYDKGFNRACKVISEMIVELEYRMLLRLDERDGNDW